MTNTETTRSRQPLLAVGLAVLALLIGASVPAQAQPQSDAITIITASQAGDVERTAARELADYLGQMYPSYRVTHRSGDGPSEAKHRRIWVGTPEHLPGSVAAKAAPPEAPESFIVTTAGNAQGERVGVVSGRDPRGTLYGVYALLEKLGADFYLSYETLPEPRETFSFDQWMLTDAPVAAPRMVFNWHNFLSGCTGWNLPGWEKWIDQSAKMRYNTVMVHAYGNNPMYRFSYNGVEKPVGYLATSARGRDWGNEHVGDVRRLHGGGVFPERVFGAEAAKGPEEERAEAATQLMQQVFAHAEERGLDVNFALDVDTRSANPPEIIETLPEEARFTSPRGHELVRPDTPEGYAYYRAQVKALMDAYPQIDRLTLWSRRRVDPEISFTTPWRALDEEHFPDDWKSGYEQALAEHPAMRENRYAPSTFALAKIADAYRRALDELGHEGVTLGFGSWGFDYLAAAAAFLPPEVTLLPLDYRTVFDTGEARETLSAAGDSQPLVPIVWAHHDDHRYIGKPYTPYADFASLLEERDSNGLGIIHWTTRPLDLYFKSLGRQTWRRTRNEELDRTVRRATQGAPPAFADYLQRWIREAPMFGRETGDRFMAINADSTLGFALADPQQAADGARERLAALQKIDRTALSGRSEKVFDYYAGMERFFVRFFEDHAALNRSARLLGTGDTTAARAALREADTEGTLRHYADFSQMGGEMTRGEKGVLVDLNTTWLPDFLDQRQRLRQTPVRLNFQPVRHSPLAQFPGRYTFRFGEQSGDAKAVWRGMGNRETGLAAHAPTEAANATDAPVAETYVATDTAATVTLGTIRRKALSAGAYDVEVVLPAGDARFDIALRDTTGRVLFEQRIELDEETSTRVRATVPLPRGEPRLALTPVRGTARVSGVVFRPRHS